jgi:hypothetical protein
MAPIATPASKVIVHDFLPVAELVADNPAAIFETAVIN